VKLQIQVMDVAVAREGLELDKALEAGEGTGYDVHRVTVMHADQLVAEKAGRTFGMASLKDEPIGYMTLWAWAALRRTDAAAVPAFPIWKARVIEIEAVDDDQEATGAADPTTPGPDTPWP
jgi:hypothetical protein